MRTPSDDPAIIQTRAWVERVVIGLRLCPFAPAPALKGTIRYATSDATTPEGLLEDLAVADELLDTLGLEGELQVASFHPDHRFAGTEADDIGNATNRSPYPTLHLLREESIARAVDSFGDTSAISASNIATLEALGHEGLEAVRRGGAFQARTRHRLARAQGRDAVAAGLGLRGACRRSLAGTHPQG